MSGFSGGVRNVHKIKDFKSAGEFLAKGKNKDDRPLPGKATRLHRLEDGSIAVKYHETDIVVYQPDGSISFDTGGWNAMTTRDKISVHLPAGWSLGVCNGVLRLRCGGYHDPEAKSWVVNRTGMITTAGDATTDGAEGDDKRVIKLRKATADFAKKLVDAFFAGEVPAPTTGDCWFCCMFNAAGKPTGGDHLIGHMDEDYLVPSLLANAVRAFGAQHDQQVLACFWTTQTDSWIAEARQRYAGADWTRQRLTNYVRRFIRRELGLEFSR